MSHPEQLGFFASCADANRDVVAGSRVLEIGSYNVNGSMRSLFATSSEFNGVDLVEGPGVDRVCMGADIDDPDGSWDVVLSGECFEHDPDWRSTLSTMVRLTRPGGLVAFTCGSRGRVEHGTRRTEPDESPGTQFMGRDHYQNVRVHEVRALPLEEWFSEYVLYFSPFAADLYFAGARRGKLAHANSKAGLPDVDRVKRLKSMMPRREKLIRVPLVCVAPLLSETHFQSLAVPYWRGVTSAVAGLHRLVSTRRRQ